jgi:hypothetical protein
MTTTPSAGPNIMDPALIADPRGGFNQMREQTWVSVPGMRQLASLPVRVAC